VLTIDDVRKRVRRLEALWKSLAKEKAIIREAEDPLHYLERHGAESARVVLALDSDLCGVTPWATALPTLKRQG
jgi:hypothetical protein